jgi:hypothetical protein
LVDLVLVNSFREHRISFLNQLFHSCRTEGFPDEKRARDINDVKLVY